MIAKAIEHGLFVSAGSQIQEKQNSAVWNSKKLCATSWSTEINIIIIVYIF